MEIINAVTALGALAHETRLALFRLLVAAGPDGLAAGDLATRLNVPPPTLSFHLRDLSAAGLIMATRAGRSVIYAADFGAMTALMGYLTENCCGGRPDLCVPVVSCTPSRKRKAS